MNRYANAAPNKAARERAINSAWQALAIALEHARLPPMDDEDARALEDNSQWPGMLADWEARLDIDVSEARELLASVADEGALVDEIEDAETALAACTDRDAFALYSGQVEDARDRLADLRAACISARLAKSNFRLWITEGYATGSDGSEQHAVEVRRIHDMGKPGVWGPMVRTGSDLCELLKLVAADIEAREAEINSGGAK